MQAATVALLAGLGFLASFIDSQVGGGGTITLPALLAAGLPAHLALGTNKLGGTSSALVASANYVHKGAVPLRRALLWAPFSLVGGAIGVAAVLHSSASWLVPVVLAVMAGMTAWVLLRPRLGTVERVQGGRLVAFTLALAALDIGVYDGILGPGTGSMLLFALVTLGGYAFRSAAALGRVLNLASNASALSYFVAAHQVAWAVGIPMAALMAAGGWAGSHVTLRHGDRWLKPLFVSVTVALMLRLLWTWI
ncbi:MAG: sulfite exporter TauE/SafE family protein [Thermoplasmatota archaeon]